MKLYYISEFSLPSNRAYSIHVFKMLNSFAKKKIDCTLFVPYLKKNVNKNFIKKFYSIKSVNNIVVHSLFKNLINLNFAYRFIYGFKICSFLKKIKQKNIIITRSLISSFLLSLFKIHHFLELHQEIKGLTKIIFINLSFIKSKYIIKLVFISKGLAEYYKTHSRNFIILHDGVDTDSFKGYEKKLRKIKKITYTGSFYKGRGIKKIIKLSKELPSFKFFLYGRRGENFSDIPKNLRIFNFVDHNKIPKILIESDLLLMPYSKKIYLSSLSTDQDISKFTSPLKMFEYLASGTPIISSNLKVLREILVDKKNSILIRNFENITEWKKQILNLKNNKDLMKKISRNAIKTAKIYSWDARVEKYLKEYLKFKNYSKI